MTSEPEAGQNLTEENGEALEVREQEGGRKRAAKAAGRGHGSATTTATGQVGNQQTNRHRDTHNGISTTYYCGISEGSCDGNTLLQCYYITTAAVVITALWL